MLLSDKDLKELAEEKELIKPFKPENCEGATINITLGNKVKHYISDKKIIMGEKISDDQYVEIDLTNKEFYLEPGQSVLVNSREYFKVPENMAAQIWERYSIKLLGLQISPASYMNPGYEGTMTFVAFNQSNSPIRLMPGIKFMQLAIFELSSTSEKPYRRQDAKYLGSNEVNISKLHLDHEIQEFLNDNGIEHVSNDTAKELGDFLMTQIEASASKVANELRAKFGEPSGY